MPGWAQSRRVAQTKFAVPREPRPTVLRPRLFAVLDAGVEGPVTLLAAPAGAGKSALLSSWIEHGAPPGPVAWLSLDADDADRRRFWGAVLEALGRATGDEAIAALEVSPREPMSMDLVLPALVDALAAREEPVVLVLEDLHEVLDAVQEDLERLTALSAAGAAAGHPHARRSGHRSRSPAPRRAPDGDPRGRPGLLAR